MSRVMSDAEIRRRKKAQGHISQTTGALGLASLGAFGASKLPGSKLLTKTPRLRRIGASKPMNMINPKKAESAALGLSTAGAGIGGAGSFNFAAYTGAESRKRQQKPKAVVKSAPSPFEDGFYGVVSKVGDWKTIDQRERTQTRQRKTMRNAGAAVGVGAGLATLGYHDGDKKVYDDTKTGLRSINNFRRMRNSGLLSGGRNNANKRSAVAAGQMIGGGYKKLSVRGKTGIAAIAAGTAVGGAAKAGHTYQQHKINQRRRGRVAKSQETSAFGISHD